ncbi:MAG: IS21 family transposase [Chloroflexota bacterium]|nr:IS21 family transposase [Chloroflexota bacterium]
MANMRITTMDISEIIRLLRAGESDRMIARMVGTNRRTVVRYREWATEQGLLEGELPAIGDLQRLLTTTLPAVLPPQQTSTVARYGEEIKQMRERGMEMAAIRSRLEERHGVAISYSAVWRFVHQLEPPTVEPVVRIEVPAGSEGQVDFGYAGLTIDPRTGAVRKSWVFVLVLSWSRHLYAEVVFDQRVATWLLCHAHAFAAFGGVPARIVPDNLKAAVVQASFGGDPVIQRSYRECADHYGFLIDPTRPRTPEHKGKVEQGGVHYVKRQFLAGRDPEPIDELNGKLHRWTAETAGQRIHGTTKERPLERFARTEQAVLLPLPRTPYDPATWKQVRVYRDCYVTFDGSYYSIPHRFVGQQVWLRAGARTVQVYSETHELLTTHDRAVSPGERQTRLDHLPNEKVPGLVLSRESVVRHAARLGPATCAIVQDLLDHRPEDRLRSAGRIVRLSEQYGAERLERACTRSRHFGETDYPAIKRILETGLDAAPLTPAEPSAAALPFTFARQVGDFVSSLAGRAR